MELANSEWRGLLGAMFFLAAMCAALGFAVGEHIWRGVFEHEAVAAGAAEYVIIDPATGATEFRWKREEARDA